jgi:very-short-patch-repair endonuclease/predicted transcriptional regulator of viral defense system
MAGRSHQRSRETPWTIAGRQHNVITRAQLLALDFSRHAIDHRLATARLRRIHRGVYAVGAPKLTRYGEWMAAVLACGSDAVLSHQSAAALWGLMPDRRGPVHASVPRATRERDGIVVHRRKLGPRDVTEHHGIPVTTPATTLVDNAARLRGEPLEAAVNEADMRGFCKLDALREALDTMPRRPGVAQLRRLLDRRTFRLTRSKLERLFIPIAMRAGLPRPLTRQWVNGYEVDFYWPELGLVVETDGLSYHRTPQQQTGDLERDQAHAAADVERCRFSHDQIAHTPEHVEAVLAAVARRLTRRA